MKFQTLEEKKAYFAKVRDRNYAASLRLEGLEPGVRKRPSEKAKVSQK